ncbi:MAG: HD domain-containing protein [Acidobacteria bacterium]|nr:MAG: HD domain-containing protein [Acidobacteriota bacterium]
MGVKSEGETLSIRDPIHGFIRTDALESALLRSRPLQRLRFIRQLGLTFLVFPGAEHSRFSHVLGTMHLAGRVYDALAAKKDGLLDPDPRCRDRRLVRVAALLHDVGHAPFSHSAEDLFEDGIDHETMTCRLLYTPELTAIFDRDGDGIGPESVERVLRHRGSERERLLAEIVSGQLDVDKMDYLLRDSLYCGVRYGSYDLERLIDTITPIKDPADGSWRIGVERTGVHALEALVMARYYMFTQVYFNVTGKVMELHLNAWLRAVGQRWPARPADFLDHDDVTVIDAMRRSDHPHARAILERERYVLAFETEEHLSGEEAARFEALLPPLMERFGDDNLLIDRSAKNPHQLGEARVLAERHDGTLQLIEEASDFIAHLSRIDMYRVYAPRPLRDEVAHQLASRWHEPSAARRRAVPRP